nr:11846_t:CDS:2 [Entrophospora candida]
MSSHTRRTNITPYINDILTVIPDDEEEKVDELIVVAPGSKKEKK